VAELPRLYDLVGLSDFAANDRDGIFQRYARDRRVEQQPHEVQRFRLFFAFILEPARAGHGKMRARRVRYHQIPVVAQYVAHVTLMVRAWRFRREQVA
jgi:plasmid stabilization system protein ParE